MNEITKKINIYSALSFCLGIIFAYFFALAPNLKLYKLLNIIGVLFNIIGILIISQYVLKNENLTKFVSDKFTAYTLISLSMIPIGMIFGSLGTMVLFILNGTQDISTVKIIGKFAGVILLFVFTPLFIIEYVLDIFFFRNLSFPESILKKTIFMGWFFLVSGLLVQLIAAILAVYS